MEMAFLPGLNVITEIGSACGKSTILRSILQRSGDGRIQLAFDAI